MKAVQQGTRIPAAGVSPEADIVVPDTGERPYVHSGLLEA
jgi:hypothetical protein